jgi:hypothetical protein
VCLIGVDRAFLATVERTRCTKHHGVVRPQQKQPKYKTIQQGSLGVA